MIRLSDIRKTVCTSTAATFIALFCYMPQAYADNTDNFTVSPTDTISPAGTADIQAAQMLGIIPETEGTNQRQKSGPKGSLKFGVGPMWTTSKLYYDEGGDYVSNFCGTGFGISFTHLAGGWFGYGLDFYGSYTTLKQSKSSYYLIRGWEYTFTQLYFGPSFVCGGNISNRLRIESSAGLGLAIHNGDGDNTKAGIGFRFSLGLELMISEKVGIGIEGLSHRHTFSKPNDFKTDDDEFYGFQQVGFLIGLRIYH